MKVFNEAQSTNEYLTGELILARQANELMTENNRRLENMFIKAVKELQQSKRVLDEMAHQVGELSTISLKRLTQ